MSNKSTADTAGRKASTVVFGYGIYMDLLRISVTWLTVMSFFLASEVHGVQRISQEGLKEDIMPDNTFAHTCKELDTDRVTCKKHHKGDVLSSGKAFSTIRTGVLISP